MKLHALSSPGRGVPAVLCAMFLALALSGCATPRRPDGKVDIAAPAYDPYEKWNRKVFNFNMSLDKHVMKPVARTYIRVFPQWGRNMTRNFLDNIHTPVVLANDVLQGESKRGTVTLGRFAINSTLGVGGLFDVAKTHFKLPEHDEDFGQTLAVWGTGGGVYLMLPLIGPSNPRDLTGRLIDYAFDPMTYVSWGNLWWVPPTRGAVDLVDARSRNLTVLDDIEKTSIDFYASVKSLHEQNRLGAIRNGKVNPNDLPDF